MQGDAAALERLLLDHYAALAAHLAKRMPQSLFAVTGVDDVVQQTYAQVFQNIRSYQHRHSASFMSWLVTIAENRLRDEVRAQKRKKRGGDFAQVRGGWLDDQSSAVRLLDDVAGPANTGSQMLRAEKRSKRSKLQLQGYLQRTGK